MHAEPGYYSLIQYCPDASRLETVNIGVVVFSPAIDYLGVRLAENNDRILRFFRSHEFRPWVLEAAKRAVAARLQSPAYRPRTLEDFRDFINTRGNDLILTAPRPVKISSPEVSLWELFRDLVQEPLRVRLDWAELLGAGLEEMFSELVSTRRAKRLVRVEVPLLGKRLTFPYAYRNGALHLVKPWQFSPSESTATSAAAKLAIEGDLIARHRLGDGSEARVVLVARFEPDGSNQELRERVLAILSEYRVKTVTSEAVATFAEEVRREARPLTQ